MINRNVSGGWGKEGTTGLPENVPRVLGGRYRFIRFLGKGGSGVVFQARDQVLGLDVAIKLFRSDGFEDEQLWQRIKRETLTGRGIRHAAVAGLRDLGQDGAHLFLVMDLVEGVTLDEHLRRQTLSPPQALSLAQDILEGLQAIHEAGIVHRDLKSRNIMVNSEGHAVITDFGLARPVSDRGLTKSRQIVGTPLCIAPEQWLGQPADQRSDLYAFGIILYTLLFGVPPFQARTDFGYLICHLNKSISFPRELRRRIPPYLLAIVSRCLEKKPEDRYQNTREILRDLQSRQPLPRKPRWNRALLWLTQPAGLGLVSLLILASFWWMNPGSNPWRSHPGRTPMTLAVLRFLAPPTPRDELGLWGGGITDLLGADLGQSDQVNLIPDTTIARFLIQREIQHAEQYTPKDLDAFLEEHPVEYLISGRLNLNGKQVTVSLEIHKGSSRQSVHRSHFSMNPSEGYFGLVDRMGQEIRAFLNLPSRREQDNDRTLEEIRTRSTPALLSYQKGKDAFLAQQFEDARRYLAQALEQDPQFAQAHFLLSMAASYSGSWPESHSHALSALRLVNRLTPRDAFLITAWKARHVDSDVSEACRILTLMHQRYPLDEEGRNLLAAALRDLGRFQDARRILTASPFRTREYLSQARRNLLFLAYMNDQTSEFRKYARQIREMGDPFADHLQFFWNLRHGEKTEALQALEAWNGTPEEKKNRKALLLLTQDDPLGAWAALDLPLGTPNPLPEKVFLGALILMARGETEQAVSLLDAIPHDSATGFTGYTRKLIKARCLEILGKREEALDLLREPSPGVTTPYLHRLWLIHREAERGQSLTRAQLMQENPEQRGWLTRVAQLIARAITPSETTRRESLRQAARLLPAEHTRLDLHAFRLLLLRETPSLADKERVDLALQFIACRQSRLLWCDQLLPILKEAAPLALRLNRRQDARILLTLLLRLSALRPETREQADQARRLLTELAAQG